MGWAAHVAGVEAQRPPRFPSWGTLQAGLRAKGAPKHGEKQLPQKPRAGAWLLAGSSASRPRGFPAGCQTHRALPPAARTGGTGLAPAKNTAQNTRQGPAQPWAAAGGGVPGSLCHHPLQNQPRFVRIETPPKRGDAVGELLRSPGHRDQGRQPPSPIPIFFQPPHAAGAQRRSEKL